MGDEGSVTITPGEQYAIMVEMRDRLLTMDGKLDGVLNASRDHESRLRVVEKALSDCVTEDDLKERSNRVLLVAGVISGIISALGAVLGVVIALH